MIGLDSNVLLRYLLQDDLVQSKQAGDFIERRLSPKTRGFVSVVAMAETAWVLDRTYGFSEEQIAAAIERTLQVDVLVVESEREVYSALTALRRREASFADALIAALGTFAGCSTTATFDRKAARHPGFTLL
jgi:predicted nucleic-acid-binding protein